MIWIAPSEKDTDTAALEKRIWAAADQFRANSGHGNRVLLKHRESILHHRFSRLLVLTSLGQLRPEFLTSIPHPLTGFLTRIPHPTSA